MFKFDLATLKHVRTIFDNECLKTAKTSPMAPLNRRLHYV